MNSHELDKEAAKLVDEKSPCTLAKDYLLLAEELDLAITIIEDSGVDYDEILNTYKEGNHE